MKSMKKVLFAGLVLAGLPVMAQAESLTIFNDTTQYSTVITNNSGVCSNKITSIDGVTEPGTSSTLSLGQLQTACLGNIVSCNAAVYMTNNCTGPVVGHVIVNVPKQSPKGITSASLTAEASNTYEIEVLDAWNIRIKPKQVS